jgi:hypothetical protein
VGSSHRAHELAAAAAAAEATGAPNTANLGLRAAHGGDGGTAARLHAPENVAAFAGKSGARRRADK